MGKQPVVFRTRDDVYAFIHATARNLDPGSRYKSELMQLIDGARTPQDIEQCLDTTPNRGRLFAGKAWHTMSLDDKLVCNLVTNETEPNRFTPSEFCFFEEVLIPHFIRRVTQTQRPVQILSLPCSMGVEVYTLAGYFLEHYFHRFRIEGKDNLYAVIRQARTGTFPYPGCPRDMTVHISADIQGRTSFDVFDITRGDLKKQYDAIFHRNLLAYFEARTATQVLSSLIRALRPGGYLIFDRFVVDQQYPALFRGMTTLERIGALPIFQKTRDAKDHDWFFESQ